MTAKALVWLRNDLRRADNPALHAASKLGARSRPFSYMKPIQNCVHPAALSVGDWSRA